VIGNQEKDKKIKIITITPNRKTDTIARIVVQGLRDLNVEIIASDLGNGITETYSDEDIIKHSKDADFIFVIWGKLRGNPSPKYYLVDQINLPAKSVYIDGSEWTNTGYANKSYKIFAPWANRDLESQKYEAKLDSSKCKGAPWINRDMYEKCRWYFKRECYEEDTRDLGLYPLNVGCINEYFENYNTEIKKDIDVLWSFGHVDTGLRYETIKVCKELIKEGYKVKFVGGGIPDAPKVSKEEYLKLIKRSKVGISAWGAGNSCMRLFEIAASGTCCIAQKTEIQFINEPRDMIDYVEYSNMEEFSQKIRHVLETDKYIEIGKQGRDFMMTNHSPKARVEYILSIIGET
jgi:hypothetical protein